MLKKMKLTSIKRVIKLSRVIIALGFIISILFLPQAIKLFNGPLDVLKLANWRKHKAFVFMDINHVYDSFLFDDSVTDNPAKLYAVSIDNQNTFICVRADYKMQSQLMPIQIATQQLLQAESTENNSKLQLLGVLKKMSKSQEEKFSKFLSELSLDANKSNTLPYILYPSTYSPYGNDFGVYLWGGIGVALLFILLIRLLKAILGLEQREIKKQLQGLSIEEMNLVTSEYENAMIFSGDIRISNTYTFCHKYAKSIMIKMDDIKAVYVEKAKRQIKKGIIKDDLFIKVKSGRTYQIVGKDTGRIIEYFKENQPKLIPLITYFTDRDS